MSNTDRKRLEAPKSVTLTHEYVETLKYQKWCEYYLDENNKETFGNATKSALKVYNTLSYNTASQIGWANVRKHKNITRLLAEKIGFTPMTAIKMLVQKAATSNNKEWWDELMRWVPLDKDLELGISQTPIGGYSGGFQDNRQIIINDPKALASVLSAFQGMIDVAKSEKDKEAQKGGS